MNTHPHARETVPEVYGSLHTREGGLTPSEAAARLAAGGANVLQAEGVMWPSILLRQLRSPFIYILATAALIAFSLRELSDGIIICAYIAVNTVVSFLQEYHSARSLELLKKFVSSRARVTRDGKESVIDAAQLVAGDVITVVTGDIIPADVRFVEVEGLLVDESVLTGESAPSNKTSAALKNSDGGLTGLSNCGFSGTTVKGGKGTGVVIAVGRATEIGMIAALATETEHVSAFEESIGMFSHFILKMVSAILVILLVVNLVIKGAGNMVQLFLFAVALAVSVIPEALPVVTTLSLSRGALKLAHQHVVVKRLSAVEDLGSIEILCADKTGTLTENKMTVADVHAADTAVCLRLAMLGAGETVHAKAAPADAFDAALALKMGPTDWEKLGAYARVRSVPFDPAKRMTLVTVRDGATDTLVVRGAPETVLALTTLDKAAVVDCLSWASDQGRLGRRTMAIAHGPSAHPEQPEKDAKNLALAGIVSFVDPIKPTSKGAIAQARRLGVKIVILTGDGKDVAEAVAREVGILAPGEQVMTETELFALSPEEQKAAVHAHSVLARMSPEGKYRVIELLSHDSVVGFLGEGINDAPALKVANVGLVVSNASDIARDAADVILLNRSLHVVVEGISLGRAVFENTIKYLKTTLISSFGNFYTIAIAELILPYLPMLPIQILLLNLLTDYPMLAISTDAVDPKDIREPKRYNVRDVVLISIVLGLVSTVFDFVFFATFKSAPPQTLQTSWFVGSALTELALLYSIRTRLPFWKATAPSVPMVALSLSSFAIVLLVPYLPLTRRFFLFGALSLRSVLLVFAIVLAYFVSSEVIKLFYYKVTAPVPVAKPRKRK